MSTDERRQKKTERLFKLVSLLQSSPNLTSRDLAERLGVTRRTIFRDLRSLTDSGVPLTYGEGTGYEILDGYQLPPLMFTAREAATTLVGLGFMKLQSDTVLQREAEGVEAKIMNVLPRDTKSFVTNFKKRTILDPYWTSTTPINNDSEGWWHQISEAVASQNSIVIDYFVQSRDEVTKRTVDPLGIVYYTDHWNLIANDHLRKTIRNFRLDRIRKLVVSMSRFTPPNGFVLQDHVDRSQMSSDTSTIVIDFDKSIADSALRTVPAKLDEKEERDDAVRATFRFDSLPYLANWLRRFGHKAVVIEPDSLKELIVEQAKEVQRLYS